MTSSCRNLKTSESMPVIICTIGAMSARTCHTWKVLALRKVLASRKVLALGKALA